LVSSFRSEVEAGFAGGVGQRLDPSVIPEPGPIEDDVLHAGGSATRRPTFWASSVLVALEPLNSFSTVEAVASVRPDASSITWA